MRTRRDWARSLERWRWAYLYGRLLGSINGQGYCYSQPGGA
jgi:hypothetical protein